MSDIITLTPPSAGVERVSPSQTIETARDALAGVALLGSGAIRFVSEFAFGDCNRIDALRAFRIGREGRQGLLAALVNSYRVGLAAAEPTGCCVGGEGVSCSALVGEVLDNPDNLSSMRLLPEIGKIAIMHRAVDSNTTKVLGCIVGFARCLKTGAPFPGGW